MNNQQNTIFQQFLQPLFGLLIDENALKKLSNSINWEQECDCLTNPDLIYPHYYKSQNFHGVTGGYLTSGAAVTYDAVTQYLLPPNETWHRQAAINIIKGKPRKILDLGCGTGSGTILLQKAFPDAAITGLDLSPYMLAIANYKANQLSYNIKWLHGLAETTNLADNSFDVVTASLLFHETPSEIAQAIVQECFRLLTSGGQVVIFDGNQTTLRQTPWLTSIFEEPYIQEYAQGNLNLWLSNVGFEIIRTEEVWWTNQVSSGFKPFPVNNSYSVSLEGLQIA
jgi:ubiquinone/menaquinone biosynthesis C-methylase UbiE